jgi:hypothetical protein
MLANGPTSRCVQQAVVSTTHPSPVFRLAAFQVLSPSSPARNTPEKTPISSFASLPLHPSPSFPFIYIYPLPFSPLSSVLQTKVEQLIGLQYEQFDPPGSESAGAFSTVFTASALSFVSCRVVTYTFTSPSSGQFPIRLLNRNWGLGY